MRINFYSGCDFSPFFGRGNKSTNEEPEFWKNQKRNGLKTRKNEWKNKKGAMNGPVTISGGRQREKRRTREATFDNSSCQCN